MTLSDMRYAWMANKRGTLRQDELNCVRFDASGLWYECPCGDGSHLAFRPMETFGGRSQSPAGILTCFQTGSQWIIDKDIAGTIRDEEMRYLKLIDSAGPIVRRVFARMGQTQGAYEYLKDTHGIDAELADDLCHKMMP